MNDPTLRRALWICDFFPRPHDLTTGTWALESAVALPGVGPWTAHYLAMRGLHDPDAFPAADLGVLKALGGTPREAIAQFERAHRIHSVGNPSMARPARPPDRETSRHRDAGTLPEPCAYGQSRCRHRLRRRPQ